MPPHPQMALVQALLVRSLVAMFWEQPLHRARWCAGARALHEDFLLPAGRQSPTSARWSPTCARTASPFEESWLDPFTEFRFPRIGHDADRPTGPI